MNAEQKRLAESEKREKHWKRWGPYVSERAWGTVREDYSAGGAAWDYLPHDHARSKAFRWNEDGIAGICDRHQKICFALALWNGQDPILKERLFGLTGGEGNHGEDVKEYYFYLDSTPTHSYMKFLYKYPQSPFPYQQLIEENRRRSKQDNEFELMDTGVFDENRYFDVFVEYAKAETEDILIKIEIFNRGPEDAPIHVLPTVWFRNVWSWNGETEKPQMRQISDSTIEIAEQTYGMRWLYFENEPKLLFTENETNLQRLYGAENKSLFAKDGINDFVVNGQSEAVNPENIGTKAAAHYNLNVPAGESISLRLRLTDKSQESKVQSPKSENPFADYDQIFTARKSEADEFYADVIPQDLSDDAKNVMRQAFAGMLWSKQFYHYEIKNWLEGDLSQPKPPPARKNGRNAEWTHLFNADVISMPDKWEYPWYAAWDLAFHCLPLALVDSDFAKEQLLLMLREWYMHPNGQLPAYEWAFSDVNPPVHAWAALRVYKIEEKRSGAGDKKFLARIFQKLLLNFTWWVNRKDSEGMNVFEGGFLGLDNIGVFDRSQKLPTGGKLAQSDGTSWMAMYCLNMLAIALELAKDDEAYEDLASKFWEHFLYIASAMNKRGDEEISLWDEQDGFFYDVLHIHGVGSFPLKVRSMVGLIPLFAVETIEQEVLDKLPNFKRRMEWFLENRQDLTAEIACMRTQGEGERRLLAIAFEERLQRILRVMFDEEEFLSPYGIRALSRFHKDCPYFLSVKGTEYRVDYEPAESSSGLFGGNSNWRGPVWFPVNYLLIESLQKFYHYLGDDFKVEFPTNSGQMMNLWEVATELSRRLSRIFLRDGNGKRPTFADDAKFQTDEHWRDLLLFHEYFHGDTGAGVGANHQTGWTGLVAKLLQQNGE
ncbi:MAG: glucosidase [Pyrinomonadaceae bacterium]